MKADVFFDLLIKNKLGPFTGVPCSLVKELINYAEHSPATKYYTATSEGEAMGIAAGLSLSGRLPVVVMQNDGLGNTVNPLTSLQLLYNLPVLLIVTWRAEPGAKADAIQHKMMGEILLDLLKLLKIPVKVLENDTQKLETDIKTAVDYLKDKKMPYALIVRRGFWDAGETHGAKKDADDSLQKRVEYIKALAASMDPQDVIMATTGFTGRELSQEVNLPGSFYMAGSMGCVSSAAMAVALENPQKKVYILDGDGACLMKMGTLATIGHYQPRNLVHILLDNGAYESTGGQKTVSSTVNFPQVALNSGYVRAETVKTIPDFKKFLQGVKGDGPVMCHVRIKSGTVEGLARPESSPFEQRDNFTRHLTNGR